MALNQTTQLSEERQRNIIIGKWDTGKYVKIKEIIIIIMILLII